MPARACVVRRAGEGVADVAPLLLLALVVHVVDLCVCVCAVSYTHLTLPTKRIV